MVYWNAHQTFIMISHQVQQKCLIVLYSMVMWPYPDQWVFRSLNKFVRKFVSWSMRRLTAATNQSKALFVIMSDHCARCLYTYIVRCFVVPWLVTVFSGRLMHAYRSFPIYRPYPYYIPPFSIQTYTKKLERLTCHDIKHGKSRRQCER